LLGWPGFFWIGAVRLVYALHFQMFVNSLLHMTPDLPEGVDSSRNIWWLGPLQFGAWGENWHRNHHSDQNAARFGRQWWQVDIGWYVICGLKKLGLASHVRAPKVKMKPRAADGVPQKHDVRAQVPASESLDAPIAIGELKV
jgi:stearoyl-CoA desaturase (delta-9 desaturase)